VNCPALARRREKQNELARKLLSELSEQYPDMELFASEYGKAMGPCLYRRPWFADFSFGIPLGTAFQL
jgi:hypothetical protein